MPSFADASSFTADVERFERTFDGNCGGCRLQDVKGATV